MKLPIYAYKHESYTQPLQYITALNEEISHLIRNMKETMWLLKSEAMHARHVGNPLALFIIEIPQEGKVVFFNGKIMKTDGGIATFMESDISIPNVQISVDRQSNVLASYQNENLETIEREFTGKVARHYLQMVDLHTSKFMVDRINKFRQKSLSKHLNLVRFGKQTTDYPLITSTPKPKKTSHSSNTNSPKT